MLTLNLRGGSRICVPAELRRITTYILAEQEDWFEDGIGFVRGWRGGLTATVDVATLDQALAEAPGEIDLLKIDVEGHETRVLSGTSGLLAARAPLILFEIRVGARTDLGPLEPAAEPCVEPDENLNPQFWWGAQAFAHSTPGPR